MTIPPDKQCLGDGKPVKAGVNLDIHDYLVVRGKPYWFLGMSGDYAVLAPTKCIGMTEVFPIRTPSRKPVAIRHRALPHQPPNRGKHGCHAHPRRTTNDHAKFRRRMRERMGQAAPVRRPVSLWRNKRLHALPSDFPTVRSRNKNPHEKFSTFFFAKI